MNRDANLTFPLYLRTEPEQIVRSVVHFHLALNEASTRGRKAASQEVCCEQAEYFIRNRPAGLNNCRYGWADKYPKRGSAISSITR
jgi:hypothetical protein